MCAYKILLSNDDGSQSPFVEPFAQALARSPQCAELRMVFPAEEQSWIGQAVTRFRPLHAEKHRFVEREGYLVNGTPADCVGLGLDHLYPERADYVVSGINLGTNASLPFYLSSGTVGAARQGFCFGVRSIAVSALLPPELFVLCREHDLSAINTFAAEWRRVAEVCAPLVGGLFSSAMWEEVDLFSINVPWNASADTEVVFTCLERASYLSLYQAESERKFSHRFRGFKRENSASGFLPNDLTTLEAGFISITPLRYSLCPTRERVELMRSEFKKT